MATLKLLEIGARQILLFELRFIPTLDERRQVAELRVNERAARNVCGQSIRADRFFCGLSVSNQHHAREKHDASEQKKMSPQKPMISLPCTHLFSLSKVQMRFK